MINRKTIAIFSGYALPHLGGIERYTENLTRQLIKGGYDVILVSSDYNFSKDIVDVESQRYSHYRLPIFKIFSSRYPIIKHNSATRRVLTVLESRKVDAIIVNTRFHLTSLFGARFGKNNDIPVFLIEHGSQHLTINNKILDYFGAKYEHLLTSYMKKLVNQYYGVSLAACEWQKHFGITSNGVWYNAIDDFIGENTVCKSNDSVKVLFAGRVLKQKGIVELLNAFSKVLSDGSNAELVIAGDGSLLEELKHKNKEKRIQFKGKLDFENLVLEYCNTDIFVYAPIWPEGLPTSILEAGLAKCAVIASPQGGITEIIEDKKEGLLINNEDEMYNALKLLINDSNLRNKYAEAIEAKVRECFLWDAIGKKVITDIDSYLEARRI